MATAQDLKSKKDLENIHKTTYAIRDSLGKLYRLYYDSIKLATDTTAKNELQKHIDTLDFLTEDNNNKELSLELKFIRQHPFSSRSLDIIDFKMHRSENLHLYDSFYRSYNLLSKNIQLTQKGIQIKEALVNFKNISPGRIAPNFIITDINNQTLELSSYRYKSFVLIDFWASWCVPCRQDFTYLKKLYKQYHPQGFEIINISKLDEIFPWKKAIKDDGIDIWKHGFTKRWDDSVLKLYFVNAIPFKILINKEGIIIGSWVGSGEENQAALTKALYENFN